MKANFKKVFSFVIAAVICITLCACSYDVTLFSDVDFKNSAYKHITNGGNTDKEAPYNIDAITGATLTVEGPAVKASVPLSVKELENTNDGLVRGVYKDKSGTASYEGMDVYYLLNKMNEGDNGIILTDKAYKVVFKDANRENIAELTIEDIESAHKAKEPVILAYGKGTEDAKTAVPFVFDGANEGEHTAGYVEELDNEDGCLKLVYNTTKYGKNKDYKKYGNVAYIYVCEKTEPGFKHNEESGKAYANKEFTDYIITVRGKTLGYELDFTVSQLESLVNYDKKGNIVEGGLGYKDFYSLANNSYWYVNEYEGLDLYKFLQYVGMPSADKLGEDAEDTMVTFAASDGYTSSEKFSVEMLSDYDNFGYYKKNSADLNDGKYVSTNADLVDTGYPVMLAYGVNNYPYTIGQEKGFVSGLSNNGGPMRVIFGKTEYHHTNGSNQIQYLSDIYVGSNVLYNTHAYTKNEDQKALARNTVNVVVNDANGAELSNQAVEVRDVEDIIYSEDASANQMAASKVKALYGSDVYEGVRLEYFLREYIGIPGTTGTVTFSNGKDKVEIDLIDLFNGADGKDSIIAFAKNGSPLVKNKKSKGYVDKIKLNPIAESDPATYKVDNCGGPLAVIIPGSKNIYNVTDIKVNIEPDKYAHLDEKYASIAAGKIKFYGEGLNSEKSFTIGEIEGMQSIAQTLDYSVLNKSGKLTQERYRGVPIYELMLNVGMKYNADKVIIHSSDGKSMTYELSDIRKTDFKNYANKDYEELLFPMLAYGQSDVSKALKEGTPLTAETGGPLKFVMPQTDKKAANASQCVKDVVAVEVTAKEMASWDHASSDLYTEFLDFEFEVVIKNDTDEYKKTFKLGELEKLSDLVVRDNYTVLDIGLVEGIDLWKLIKYVAEDIPGVDDPISVSGYASDNYSKDFLSVFGKEALEQGVLAADGTRKPIVIAYAFSGYPLVDSESHEGYTGLVGNAYGPCRFICETNQGASVKYAQKVVVTIEGSGPIK